MSRKGRLQGRSVILVTLIYLDVVAARTSGLRSSRMTVLNREAAMPSSRFSSIGEYLIWEAQHGSLKRKPPLSWPGGLLYAAISHSEFCWNRNIIRERAKLTGARFVSHSFAVSSVQSLSCVQLFVTPWIAVCQASLSITNSFAVPRFKLLLLCF